MSTVHRPVPHDPTSPAQPLADPDGSPPPAPPHELADGAGTAEREFEADGQRWVARVAGKGAAGTGAYGLGLVEAIHFFDANAPDRPLREALLPRGRFAGLFDSELAELLARATPIVVPDER